jgi:hypothetical protein
MEVHHLAGGPDTIAKEAEGEDSFGIDSAIGDQQVQMEISLEERSPVVASWVRGPVRAGSLRRCRSSAGYGTREPIRGLIALTLYRRRLKDK